MAENMTIDPLADALANLYTPTAEKIRAQGLLSRPAPVRGQSVRGR
ncbi:hypothetical protein AB0D57_05690 [Streptomyces sp. NPDC048275]